MGIDGNWWVKEVLLLEPLQIAIGGTPLTMEAAISSNIQLWKQIKSHPLFVFSGINVTRPPSKEPKISHSIHVQQRKTAWETYRNGNEEEAKIAFQNTLTGKTIGTKTLSYLPIHLVRNFAPLFQQSGSQVFFSPYSASSQVCATVFLSLLFILLLLLPSSSSSSSSSSSLV